MALIVYVYDVNTLHRLGAHGKLSAGTYTAESDTSETVALVFSPPPNTGFSLTVTKPDYTTKTVTGRTSNIVYAVDQPIDVYLTPPPPPIPPPSGEDIIGTVGTSCDVLQKSMFGRPWYAWRNRYTGAHSGWDSELGDAQHFAGQDASCFVIPSAPPAPEAPGNVVDAIAQKVTASENTLSGKLTDIKNSIETKVGDTLAGITNLTSIVTDIRSRLDVLAPIKKFTDEFKFPSWDAVIVQPINGLLQPLRDLKADVGNFLTFSWFDALIAKVEDAIDRRASALVGVDPAKPFWDGVTRKLDAWFSHLMGVDPDLPFFDAVYAKYERKIDVWISGKFDIDVEKPFLDELERKLVSSFVRVIDKVMDQIIPPPPKVI